MDRGAGSTRWKVIFHEELEPPSEPKRWGPGDRDPNSVTARPVPRFTKQLVLPLLPGCCSSGRLLYRLPLEDILCGCCLETSAYDAHAFTPEAFTQLLLVPAEHLVFSGGGFRIALGTITLSTIVPGGEQATAAQL